MSRRVLTVFLGCVLASALPTAVKAQAGNYYLNAADANNGVDVALLTGSWSVGVSNGAWSPWNYVSNCDGAGANCQTGFHTVFYYTIDGGPVTKWGWDGSERTTFNPFRVNDFYATPELALPHAFAPFTIDAVAPSTLHLFIPDCCFWDNTGGLTVTVAAAAANTTVAPEPSSMALVAAGLAGIVATVRRRKRMA